MYIHKDVRVIGAANNAHVCQACLKISYRDVEISISFDNSCGCMEHLGRADIRVYVGKDFEIDITDIIKRKKDRMIYCQDIDDLVWVKRRIDRAFKLDLIRILEYRKGVRSSFVTKVFIKS